MQASDDDEEVEAGDDEEEDGESEEDDPLSGRISWTKRGRPRSVWSFPAFEVANQHL
jgi:hypothetical protein